MTTYGEYVNDWKGGFAFADRLRHETEPGGPDAATARAVACELLAWATTGERSERLYYAPPFTKRVPGDRYRVLLEVSRAHALNAAECRAMAAELLREADASDQLRTADTGPCKKVPSPGTPFHLACDDCGHTVLLHPSSANPSLPECVVCALVAKAGAS